MKTLNQTETKTVTGGNFLAMPLIVIYLPLPEKSEDTQDSNKTCPAG